MNLYHLILIVGSLIATLMVLPIDCQVYPSNKLFVENLETICYDEILDSCSNNAEELDKPGHQIYCMFCRGGVYQADPQRNQSKPKSSINFPNLYARFYGCFKEEKYIDCAYDAVYRKYRDTLFDLSDPGSDDFVSLQRTLSNLYRKGAPYC